MDSSNAAEDSIKFHELNGVTINSQRNFLISTSPTPLHILNGKDLEQINSLSVAEAIRYFSGVQLKDYGGISGLKTINVRSLGSNHTAVFYDGIQLGNAQNGQVDLGKFSLDNIEQIALYNGQNSDIFQSAKAVSAGSSLYLTAKKPSFNAGKKDHIGITFKTGSFGLINPSISWQHKITTKLFSAISAEWMHADGRYKFRYSNGVYDTSARRSNGDINAVRVEAGLFGKTKDSANWTVKGYVYNSERGLPGAIIANKFDYSQRQWDRNAFLQSSYQKSFGLNYSLQLTAKYANDYTRYLDPDFITTNGSLNNKFYQQEFYISLANKYRIKSYWDVVLSADYQWNKLDANLYRFVYPTRHTLLAALASDLHFNRFNLQASLLGTFVNDKVRDYTATGDRQEYSPAISFSWQPVMIKDFRIRGSFKQIFRLPTFNDLYYTFVGNIYLSPENTEQYDLGITYNKSFHKQLFSFISFQVDAYYNKVKDKIVAVPGANLFRWTMYNLGKVAIKGLEFNGQTGLQISNKFSFNCSISYTYQDALDMSGDENYKNQIPYTPLHSGSIAGGASWKKYSMNYSFIYTGERYSQKTNIPVNYLQPWYTQDLSVGWKGSVAKHSVKTTMEVNNLFNQYYDVINNFPMPGRSYRLSITCNLVP